jgi:hypothetical protein
VDHATEGRKNQGSLESTGASAAEQRGGGGDTTRDVIRGVRDGYGCVLEVGRENEVKDLVGLGDDQPTTGFVCCLHALPSVFSFRAGPQQRQPKKQ